MALSAFHGRDDLRSAALARLALQLEAGRLDAGSFFWNGESGSVAGCLAESDDAQRWVDGFGLPRWLAYALDAVTSPAAAPAALARATAVLGAIRPGSDASPLGSRVMCRVLHAACGAAPTRSVLVEAATLVQRLHGRCLRADPPTAAEWRQVRRQAMAVADALTTPAEQAVAACVEAAGWDPLTSPTAVADVLRQWMGLESLKADAEFGWTQADHDHIQARLDRLHDDPEINRPGETRDVFQLLEVHHPDDARRLKAHHRFDAAHRALCAERAATLLIGALGAAA